MDMNTENKMTVREFVEKYNSLQGEKTKEALIDSVIERHYAPILKKRATLELIFEKCIKEKDGVQYIDSFLVQLGLMQAVLILYTNLETKHVEGEPDNIFTDYDLLMETGIYPIIMFKIGEKDMKELMSISASIEETFMNQQTFEAYLSKQVTRFAELFGRVGGSGMEALARVLEDEDKMNKITKTLEKIAKEGKFNLVK